MRGVDGLEFSGKPAPVVREMTKKGAKDKEISKGTGAKVAHTDGKPRSGGKSQGQAKRATKNTTKETTPEHLKAEQVKVVGRLKQPGHGKTAEKSAKVVGHKEPQGAARAAKKATRAQAHPKDQAKDHAQDHPRDHEIENKSKVARGVLKKADKERKGEINKEAKKEKSVEKLVLKKTGISHSEVSSHVSGKMKHGIKHGNEGHDKAHKGAGTDKAKGKPAKRESVNEREATERAVGLLRDSIVDIAKKQRGIPYHWGEGSPERGFDCSGLVQYVMRHVGVHLPRVARAQATIGQPLERSIDALKPGDLLSFGHGEVEHIGIYIGHGRYIHAPHTGANVTVADMGRLHEGWWRGARRVVALQKTDAPRGGRYAMVKIDIEGRHTRHVHVKSGA